MAGLPEIVTSVAALVQDVQDARREVTLRNQQVDELHAEIQTRDRRIQALERERNDHAQLIDALKLEVRQLRITQKAHTPPGSPEAEASTTLTVAKNEAAPTDESKPTFVSLPRAPADKFDVFDNHVFGDKRAHAARSWRSGKMKPVNLREVEWQLTTFPPPDRPYPGKDEPEEAAPAVPMDASPSEQTTSDVQAEWQTRDDEMRRPSPRRYFDPADPRRDSLRHSIFDPGQWDETDEDFVVERGPLPPKTR
ncbi:hypothetical protein LTR56_009761 [Elasticomyces elasticus]|nr:hypothetical protein LTR56_009761 [Elasticomyces elasticus]KAK4919180.1 hypothetical protein LTR49_013184 [Elasticomyces elasticus]